MTRFEYSTVVFDIQKLFASPNLDHEAFQSHLNEQGAQGWELVNIFTISRIQGATAEVIATFKRPLA